MNDKFDPSWRETPDLPGELYDEEDFDNKYGWFPIPAATEEEKKKLRLGELRCASCGHVIDPDEEPEPLRRMDDGSFLHGVCYDHLLGKFQ